MLWPVFDGTKGEQQSELIAGQRVCFFWPHDGAAATIRVAFRLCIRFVSEIMQPSADDGK